MNPLKINLLDNPPIQLGVRFVISGPFVEKILLSSASCQWEAFSYDTDYQLFEDFSLQILVPWCQGWVQGSEGFLPLKESEGTAILKKGLRGIERGMTISYMEFGKRLSTSPRAAGRLLGLNRFPLAIACHRVICKDGSLGGFSGGVDLKQRLLQFETIERSST